MNLKQDNNIISTSTGFYDPEITTEISTIKNKLRSNYFKRVLCWIQQKIEYNRSIIDIESYFNSKNDFVLLYSNGEWLCLDSVTDNIYKDKRGCTGCGAKVETSHCEYCGTKYEQ